MTGGARGGGAVREADNLAEGEEEGEAKLETASVSDVLNPVILRGTAK